MAWLEPQSGQVNMDMFSTRPRIGTWVLLNMVTPFLASIRAISCGVDTITAPFSGTRWAMVSWASPVPGGMSSTSTSSGAPATSFSIWVSALCTIGPRLAVHCPFGPVMVVVLVLRHRLRLILVRGQNRGDGLHALHAQRHGIADLAQGLGLGAATRRPLQPKADMTILDHQALDHVLL